MWKMRELAPLFPVTLLFFRNFQKSKNFSKLDFLGINKLQKGVKIRIFMTFMRSTNILILLRISKEPITVDCFNIFLKSQKSSDMYFLEYFFKSKMRFFVFFFLGIYEEKYSFFSKIPESLKSAFFRFFFFQNS